MESNTPATQQAESPAVALNDLSIVLAAHHIDTAHINPDFLRYNEIVDSDWTIEHPVIIESGFSLIQYGNGLSLTATNDDLAISHRGARLAMDEIVSPAVASRYLARASWTVDYRAIHINLNGSMDVADQKIELDLSPLHRLSSGMLFHDTAPNVQARVFYQFDDKAITVFVAESVDAGFVESIHFHASMSRGFDNDSAVIDRIDLIDSIIENWQADVDDCVKLASRFYHSYGN